MTNERVKERRKLVKLGMIFKLDVEKVYNRVDCRFFERILSKKGLGERWLGWMKGCVEYPFYAILMNDYSKGFFPSSRCPRQGDPLFTMCFTLVVNTFKCYFF